MVFRIMLINFLFPHKLSGYLKSKSLNIKVITIATDCVYSGNKGGYIESDIPDPVDFMVKANH